MNLNRILPSAAYIGHSVRSMAALFVMAALLACASEPPISAPANPAPGDFAVQYRLGPGDQVRVTVFNQSNISGEFALDGTGHLALPLIGIINGTDKTLQELAKAIADSLTRSGYLVNPNVSVQVMQFRPYYILGEINQPGAYPYSANLTVRKAVAAARGYTYRANTRRVYIQRSGEKDERLYEVTPSTAVLPGDTVRIPERLF